jgi:hypothetical protein
MVGLLEGWSRVSSVPSRKAVVATVWGVSRSSCVPKSLGGSMMVGSSKVCLPKDGCSGNGYRNLVHVYREIHCDFARSHFPTSFEMGSWERAVGYDSRCFDFVRLASGWLILVVLGYG